MPRLTDSHYLEIHHHVRRVWLEDPHPLSALSANEQWDIHRYFAPDADLSDDELLVHRRRVTRFEPNTPARAGRAYGKLLRAIDAEEKFVPAPRFPRKKYQRGEAGLLTVRAVVRPKLDVEQLARALIEIAFEVASRHK